MKYEKYKNIGLPWFPNGIPNHWQTKRHKNVLTERKELVGNDEEKYTLLSLTLNGVIIRDLSNAKGKFSKDYKKYVIVNEGDFVFCLFDVDETPRTVGLSKHHGMITGAYDIFKPHDINSDYFYYYYLSLDNNKLLKPLYTGLRKVIAYTTFMSMKFPVPPREEQDQIVRYLDWKVSAINKLIHGYQKQIKLLEERKKTAIDKAVTLGIDSSTEYFTIGSLWNRKIPLHWKRVPIVSIAKEKSICNCSELELLSVFLGVGIVPFSNMGEKRTNATSKDTSRYQRVDPGDLVMNNQQAWRGSVGVSDYTGIVSPAYIVLQLDNSLFRKYANYLMRSSFMIDQFYIVSKGVGSIQRNIYWPDFKHAVVPIPPEEEQKQIAHFLDRLTEKIDESIQKCNESIELLYEYRTRLISDVVTGQIDVRNVIIPEYEVETAEIESNDEEGDLDE